MFANATAHLRPGVVFVVEVVVPQLRRLAAESTSQIAVFERGRQ